MLWKTFYQASKTCWLTKYLIRHIAYRGNMPVCVYTVVQVWLEAVGRQLVLTQSVWFYIYTHMCVYVSVHLCI